MSIQTRLGTLTGTALVVTMVSIGAVPLAQAAAPTLSVRPAVAPTIAAPARRVLPRAVDRQTPYQPQVSCDPRPTAGVQAFAALMRARYRTGAMGMNRTCRGDISEHYDGRALDWMLNVRNPRQRAIAYWVVNSLSRGGGVMARRFGISYIIWNTRMWREYAPQRGWTRYTGAVPHTDHIHFSFSWDGAMRRTSWWTGRANTVVDRGPCRVYAGQFAPLRRGVRTAPCPTRLRAAPRSVYRVAVVGQRSAQIAVAQRRLRLRADGAFGIRTFYRLAAWQARARVPKTGVLDKATWRRMVGR